MHIPSNLEDTHRQVIKEIRGFLTVQGYADSLLEHDYSKGMLRITFCHLADTISALYQDREKLIDHHRRENEHKNKTSIDSEQTTKKLSDQVKTLQNKLSKTEAVISEQAKEIGVKNIMIEQFGKIIAEMVIQDTEKAATQSIKSSNKPSKNKARETELVLKETTQFFQFIHDGMNFFYSLDDLADTTDENKVVGFYFNHDGKASSILSKSMYAEQARKRFGLI